MTDKLLALQHFLTNVHVESRLMRYEFFDVNLIPELVGIELFDFPLFLNCDNSAVDTLSPVVFDVRTNKYHWIKCKSAWTSNAAEQPTEVYSANVLKMDYELFSTDSAEAMRTILLNQSKIKDKSSLKNYLNLKAG
jgi:arginine-tRNA-protein transferase